MAVLRCLDRDPRGVETALQEVEPQLRVRRDERWRSEATRSIAGVIVRLVTKLVGDVLAAGIVTPVILLDSIVVDNTSRFLLTYVSDSEFWRSSHYQITSGSPLWE